MVIGESLEVGDKEGRSSKLFVLPCEPELVTSVPRQGVEVCEEGGLLHLLPQKVWRVARVDLFLALM